MRAVIAELVSLKHGRMFWIPRSDVVPAMADWPDLVLIVPPRVIFCELKSQTRRITPGQADVIALLESCSDVDALIVRPVPKEGEISYDDLIGLIKGIAS